MCVYECEDAESLLIEDTVFVLRNGKVIPEKIPDDTEAVENVSHH